MRVNQPEHQARYYPRDTIAFVWVTLVPEQGQKNRMTEIFQELSEYRSVEDWIEKLEEATEEFTGTNQATDIKRWLGPDLSAGIIQWAEEPREMEAAATAAVRNPFEAKYFMHDWLDAREERGIVFDFSGITARGPAYARPPSIPSAPFLDSTSSLRVASGVPVCRPCAN